jgi:quercetin dioxygenase-like cupin family protein
VLICGGAAALVAIDRTRAQTSEPAKEFRMDIDIKRNGSRPSQKGPENWFTGTVRIDPLFQAPEPARRCRPGHVRTRRTHRVAHASAWSDAGRVGLGWVQREGGTIEEIRPGDVVWFPPGLKHWHGASPTTAMTHIAIQESVVGKNVDWMEKVGDEQYRK